MGAVGHGLGEGGKGVAEAVIGLLVVPELGGDGYPAYQFIDQNQGRLIADKSLQGIRAGIAEFFIVFFQVIVGGGAAQVVGEESGKGFGAAAGGVEGAAADQVGIFPGVADQFYGIDGQVRIQQAAGTGGAD